MCILCIVTHTATITNVTDHGIKKICFDLMYKIRKVLCQYLQFCICNPTIVGNNIYRYGYLFKQSNI